MATTWHFCGKRFEFDDTRATLPLIMGIVNATPDSFSDGGRYRAASDAIAHALRLVQQGADIIDVGGQSTRPGSDPVSLTEELERVLPVIEGLRRQSDVVISIDTSKAEVARQAIERGAHIVNDVTALREDAGMLDVVKNTDCGVILMHMIGTPKTMQDNPSYSDVVAEIRSFLSDRVAWLAKQGVIAERIAVDPGIGFGKTHEHNLTLVRALATFCGVGRPVCLGASRKGFIGKVLTRTVDERVFGDVAVSIAGYLRGVHLIRVHDVAATRDALVMTRAIETGRIS